MKNLLFLGLGSIGQRHFRNLKKIDKRLNFFCIRKKNITPLLDNQNKVKNKKINLTKIGIKEITFKDIKKYQLNDYWMNSNLMCMGEKTSRVLNEIKWKKIFLFNPGEEEYLLYKI